MKLTPWLVLLSLITVSCSGSKSAQKVNEETPQIELSDADEFIENPSEDSAAGDALADDSIETPSDEPMVTDSEPMVTDSEPMVTEAEPTSPVVSYESGTTKQYVVQKNETLMMIAFKLYGDYGRWKELASQNREVLKGSTTTRVGMTLNYLAPAEEFIWNPQGNPYLIKTGDTLGYISKEVYATAKKWKLIWENNRPLIKDPNKIYAGFTIYTLDNGREVANEI
jgi:nucleoid-associated protein YgaU